MKGPRCGEEIEAAVQTFHRDYELDADIAYRIPHTPHRRRLVIFRRETDSAKTSTVTGRHRIRVIESEGNPLFKELKKLHGGRGIKKLKRTLVCGQRLTDEVLRQSPQRCRAWISQGDRMPPPETARSEMDWIQLPADLFRALDLFGTRTPMVLYEIPALQEWHLKESPPAGCSLLVPFQDPENVGAVIRTATAMHVARIILLSECANPFHPKSVRASAGSVFSAPLVQGPSLSDLPEALPVIALSSSGKPLGRTPFPTAFYLLTGMEGPGLPARWRDNAVSIPMASGVESLNAAVATAIALYEWRRSLG
jgi:tRNA G18 (ribose-2'-O)-methylase SpoU